MEQQSYKKIVRMTSTTGGIADVDVDTDRIVKTVHKYQVYRGMSPGTSNRLEARIRELEDALEAEREARMRAERQVGDITFQFESIQDRLEEYEGQTAGQLELGRKRCQKSYHR